MNKWTSGANAQLRMLALKMFCRKREMTVSKYMMFTSPSCSGTPFDPFPNNPLFLRVCGTTLQNNFLPFSLNSELSSANFSIWKKSLKFVVWERVNGEQFVKV